MSDSLTPAERAAVVAQLERSRDGFLAAMALVPAAAWAQSPAPGRWSAGECAEHVIKIERGMRTFLTSVLAAAPADPARRGALAGRDTAIADRLRDRSRARPAPDSVHPQGRYPEPAPAIADFARARDVVLDFARTTPADLRAIALPHPALGELDGYQWLLFVAYHTDRHTLQLEELRAALAP